MDLMSVAASPLSPGVEARRRPGFANLRFAEVWRHDAVIGIRDGVRGLRGAGLLGATAAALDGSE